MSIVSYAQNFEDVMLWRALQGVADGFYVDVGAHHPRVDSVSHAFHEQGWSGIHIEPTPDYSALLRAEYPGDEVIEAAVSDRRGQVRLHRFPGTGLSTLDEQAATRARADGFEVQESLIRTITLDDVIDGIARDIHWLKIDVEGHERSVLDGWGGTTRPWIVLIESTRPGSRDEVHQNWEPLIVAKGYRFVWFDGLNRFYVHETRPELTASFAAPPNVFDMFRLSGEATSAFAAHLNGRATEANEHRAAALAASEAAIRALEADHDVRTHAHEQMRADLIARHTREQEASAEERHTLAADHARRLQEAAAENRRLTDALVQTSAEQAAVLAQLHAERAVHEEQARSSLEAAHDRFGQAVGEAAAERKRFDEALADMRHRIDSAQAELQATRLIAQAAADDAAATAARLKDKTAQLEEVRAQGRETRDADEKERQRLLAQQRDLELRLAGAQEGLQAALLARQAEEARAETAREGLARMREHAGAAAAAQAARQALLHRVWREQLGWLRSVLDEAMHAADLTERLADTDRSIEDTALQQAIRDAPGAHRLQVELSEFSKAFVDLVRFSERFEWTFRDRLRLLMTGPDRLTRKYVLATSLTMTAGAERSVQDVSQNLPAAVSKKRGDDLTGGTRTSRWFDLASGRQERAIAQVESAMGAVHERMDRLSDIGAILIGQGVRADEARIADRISAIEAQLAQLGSSLDRLSDLCAIGIAQGSRHEDALENLRCEVTPVIEPTMEQAAIVDATPPMPLAATATFDMLSRILRSCNG